MPSEPARHWTLDPGTIFLNHGSFGDTPRPVLVAQAEWRERMEREPVAFFARDLEPAMDEARAALGEFIGADPDDLVLVPNATAGINMVGPWPQRPDGEPWRRVVRISAAPYVAVSDLELLAGILPGIIGTTARLG